MAPVCHPNTPRCANCGANVAQEVHGYATSILCARALQRIKFLGDNRGEWMSPDSWCPLHPFASVQPPAAGQPPKAS